MQNLRVRHQLVYHAIAHAEEHLPRYQARNGSCHHDLLSCALAMSVVSTFGAGGPGIPYGKPHL